MDPGPHPLQLRGEGRAGAEVGADPVAQAGRLAHIKDIAPLVAEQINPGLGRQGIELLLETF
jgi:hypothetical protein